MDIRLSQYGQANTRPSPVNVMMAAFATDFRDGVDINLGVGYVNERTIPGRTMLEAMEAVLADPKRYRQAFNYGAPQGSPNLIASIRRFYLAHGVGQVREATLDAKQVIIGPSGATSILDALAEVLPPGVVITADPMYYIYCNALERKGFRVVTAPEDGLGIDPDRVEEKLRLLGDGVQDLSFFYFITVNNPSCSLLANERRRRLVEIAARVSKEQGRRIPIFFDMAYELLLHDPEAPAFESALNYDEVGVAYEIGTLSKVLAPALRAGFLIGPPGQFMDAMVQKTSDVGFSAPLITQEMASYLLDHHIAAQLENVNAGYREKAKRVKAAIDAQLAPHLAGCVGGSAGFYYYLTFAQVETHTQSQLFKFLTRTTEDPEINSLEGEKKPRVIYIPGEYCVHPKGDLVDSGRRQLRLSYGFEETEVIEQAVALIREGVEYALGG